MLDCVLGLVAEEGRLLSQFVFLIEVDDDVLALALLANGALLVHAHHHLQLLVLVEHLLLANLVAHLLPVLLMLQLDVLVARVLRPVFLVAALERTFEVALDLVLLASLALFDHLGEVVLPLLPQLLLQPAVFLLEQLIFLLQLFKPHL